MAINKFDPMFKTPISALILIHTADLQVLIMERADKIGFWQSVTGSSVSYTHLNVKLVFEPGRALVGNAGVLLTKVEYLKPTESKNFAIVDAAMNDLMRPALYDAYHDIQAVQPRDNVPLSTYEIVGPVCESGDFLGHDRNLALAEGDLLAIMSAGAYGMSMASNYNTRPRAAEVMIDGGDCHLIRKREIASDLFILEKILP